MTKKETILTLSLVFLFLLTATSSYYRFAVQMDYVVSYEGPCDPETESCYVECDDNECTNDYYFTVIERNAKEVSSLCGPDVSECDESFICQPDVDFCEVTYCDAEVEEEGYCDDINESNV